MGLVQVHNFQDDGWTLYGYLPLNKGLVNGKVTASNNLEYHQD